MAAGMVLRMKKERRYAYLFSALILSLLFLYPWLTKDFVGIEHDTFFHLSRIEGLAQEISRRNFLPAVYPGKNGGYGYAGPLFYCDILLYPSALLYLAGLPLSWCYISAVFLFTFLTAYFMEELIDDLTGKPSVSIAIAAAYLFCNYRITDVYVRSALGEVAAMMFLPVLLRGLFRVLYQEQYECWTLLCAGLTGLAFSHNLTFLMGVVLFIITALMQRAWKNRRAMKALVLSAGIAFLLTAWFTLPMIEQLRAQDLYVSWYAKHSDLANGALSIGRYFVNHTIFGYSGKQYAANEAMVVNPGWFLMFASLPVLYLKRLKNRRFVLTCLILGWIFMILPSDLIPWKYLSFLSVLQFPWRLMTPASLLLCVPCAAVLSRLRYEALRAVVLVILLCEGLWHVHPVYTRTFGITSQTLYSDITEGKICDPYYSATYMRVELAGGDYLPQDSPDFRDYKPAVRTGNSDILNIEWKKNGQELTLTVPEEYLGVMIEVPLTWYKGYRVYYQSEEALIPVETVRDSRALVSFTAEESGAYLCRYESTGLRKLCIGISLLSWIVAAVCAGMKKTGKQLPDFLFRILP